MTPDGNRRPLWADYDGDYISHLDLASLREHLSAEKYHYPQHQVLVFDMCATIYDELRHGWKLPDFVWDAGPHTRGGSQFLMFASENGRPAINKSDRREGDFTRELVSALRSAGAGDTLDQIHRRAIDRFAELRAQGKASQRPVRYTWRDPGGDGDENSVLLPADWGLYLQELAGELARSAFPWRQSPTGIPFFLGLHMQV
jgi:hypothetical protein